MVSIWFPMGSMDSMAMGFGFCGCPFVNSWPLEGAQIAFACCCCVKELSLVKGILFSGCLSNNQQKLIMVCLKLVIVINSQGCWSFFRGWCWICSGNFRDPHPFSVTNLAHNIPQLCVAASWVRHYDCVRSTMGYLLGYHGLRLHSCFVLECASLAFDPLLA